MDEISGSLLRNANRVEGLVDVDVTVDTVPSEEFSA
jgi:hypothetical protein